MNKNRKLFKIFAPFVLICGGVTLMTSCNEPDVEPEVHFVKQFSELKPYDCITSFTFNISGDPYNPEADTITNIVLGETENFSTYDTPENTYITLELHTSYIVQTIMFYQVSDGIVLANESFTITNYFTWDMETLTGTFTTHYKEIKSITLNAPSLFHYATFTGFYFT